METDLTLVIWPDYINPLTIEQFQNTFDIRVKQEIIPSAVELMERMRASGEAPDVICAPDYAIRELDAEARLLQLDHAMLPNLIHLEPRFYKGRAHDPESRMSVIKDWGTTGYMYRTDVVTETPRSWADFWTLAEKYSKRVTVLDSPAEVMGAALKRRGHSYNTEDALALQQARIDLLDLKPHLLAFETNYRPFLISGEAWLALGWNGDAVALKAGGVPIHYVIPSEGSQLWEDDWAIAATAPHPQSAYAFINFLLLPEIAAQEAHYTGYATANKTVFAILDEHVRSDPSIYPTADVLQKLEQGLPLSTEGNRTRNLLWSEIRSE